VPDDGYANENRNTFEELFFGPAWPQRDGDADSSRLCVCGAAFPTMRNSHNRTSDFPSEKIAKTATIPRVFDFARDLPGRRTEASNAKNACLALLFRTYRFLRDAIISQCSK
jgi:hypothetical protein